MRKVKQKLVLVIILLLSVVSNSQIKNSSKRCGVIKYDKSPVLSCNNKEHYNKDHNHITDLNSFDRFGNIYCTERLINNKGINAYSYYDVGHFTLTIDDNFSDDYVAVMIALFEDLDSFIIFNNSGCFDSESKISMHFYKNNLDSGVLAAATNVYQPYRTNSAKSIINSTIWEAINIGGHYAPSIVQISAQSIDNNEFYTGNVVDANNDGIIDSPEAINKYDLYSVLLHEIMHNMGFASLLLDQNFNIGTSFWDSFFIGKMISHYDALLLRGGNSIVDTTTDPYQWSLADPDFFNNCEGVINTGNTSHNLNFVTTPWQLGTSLSHIDDNCPSTIPNANHLMSPTFNTREYKRLSQEEVGVLQQLDYRLNANSGMGNYQVSNFDISYAIDTPCYNQDENDDPKNIAADYIHIPCEQTSYAFSEDFLLANDINIQNTKVVNLQLWTDQQLATLTLNNGLYTVSFHENWQWIKLKYQLKNIITGRISNTANINFYRDTCESYGEDYDNELGDSSGCNLIANSRFNERDNVFNDIDSCGKFIGFGSALTTSLFGYLPVSNTSLPGWYPNTGLTFIRTNGCDYSGINMISNDDNFIQTSGFSSLITKLKDSIYPSKKYILSFAASTYKFSNPNHYQHKVRMGLVSVDNDIPLINYFASNPYSLPQEALGVYDGELYATPNDNGWKQHIKSITNTTSNTYNGLFIGHSIASYDNVELVEDKLTAEYINTEITIADCSVSTTLGTDMCDIAGLKLAWFDITDGANIQLTENGTDLINTDNVSIAALNGSQISINNYTGNKTYELRRTFVASITDTEGEVAEILENDANASIQVQITINCNPTTTYCPSQSLEFYSPDKQFVLIKPESKELSKFVDKSFSLETVFKYVRKEEGRQYIVHYYNDDERLGIATYINTSNNFVFVYNDQEFIVENYKLPEEKCLHISVVKEAEKLIIYSNGEIIYSNHLDSRDVTLERYMYFGGIENKYNFNGEIDEIRFYANALTQREININLFSTLSSNQIASNLVAYYNFEIETNGNEYQTIYDVTNNNNNGKLGFSFEEESYDPKRIEATCIVNPTPIAPIINSMTSCNFVLPSLPEFTSNTYGYYTQSGGNGTQLFPGDEINTTQTIYIYVTNGVCYDESNFTFTYDCNTTNNDFVTTWNTERTTYCSSDAFSIKIPTNSNYTYNYDIDWNNDNVFDEFGVTGDITHIYNTSGEKTIRIRGQFPAIYFNVNCERAKILAVNQWGAIHWQTMNNAFNGCENLNILAEDGPDLSNVTDMSYMFYHCALLNQNINHWNTSNVKNMSYLFFRAVNFNQSLDNWQTDNVENMSDMFHAAVNFNQNINTWNTSNVTNARGMFLTASSFNQSLGNWQIENLLDATSMLDYTNISTSNYDDILINWSNQNLQNNVVFGAKGLTYCMGENARYDIIQDFNWEITDSGYAQGCIRNNQNIDNKVMVNSQDTLYSIYPNPATTNLNITSLTNTKDVTISIYNMLGSLINTRNYSNNNQQFNEQINISNLTNGSYYIRIIDQNGAIQNSVFIKK